MIYDILIINENKHRRDFLCGLVATHNDLSAVSCNPSDVLFTACKALGEGIQFDIVVSDFYIRPQVGIALAEALETLYAEIGFNKKIIPFTIPQLVSFLTLTPETRKPSDVFQNKAKTYCINHYTQLR